MSWDRHHETPLHLAVLEENLPKIGALRDRRSETNRNGFTPLDLAKWLDKQQAMEVLAPSREKKIRVQRRYEGRVSEYSVGEFEKLFGIHYLPYLKFPSYRVLRRVQRNCPMLLKYTSLGDASRQSFVQYQRELEEATIAPISIRWIDPIMGYGVFADWDIEPGTFIGEYTGLVRRFFRLKPDHNGYCFHYPTRFFSWRYYMVDAQEQGNELRFINHGDHPNLQPICIMDKDILHLCLVTKEFIPRGQQLTFDYGTDYWRRRKKREELVSESLAYCQPELEGGA